MNNRRKEKSGGQALVMVTLALIAMTGIMGLAVDLGWSFFVKKEAQSAADGAALAAAQEAIAQIRASGANVTGFTCGSVMNVDCQTTPTACGSISASSNLKNGCLYAKQNGFDYTTASSRQNVTIRSNDATTLPTTPQGQALGVNNIVYWVTVQTVQTIPQLFSAVLGNTTGTVSAVATAGIVGEVVPGSFYGMNHRGDCLGDNGGGCFDQGLDVNTGNGKGGTNCAGAPGGSAQLCAPSGIILGSSCNGSGSGCSQSYAGEARTAYGSSLTVMQDAQGNKGQVSGTWTPSTPTWSTDSSSFNDPTSQAAGGAGSQPPIGGGTNSGLGSCGYPQGILPSGFPLGPYNYYSYRVTAQNIKVPDGNPIQVPSDVTFSASAVGCPGVGAVYIPGAVQGTPAFPTYVFWGGLDAKGSTVTFGPGQYVMAGTKDSSSSGAVLSAGGTLQGDSATGTMFVFTDGNYPGLDTQATTIPGYAGNMPTLYQGGLNFKNVNIDLSGLVNSTNTTSKLPSSMDAYSGVAWWQDRRNSTVGYNEAPGSPGCPDCTADDGSVIYCNIGCPASTTAKLAALETANHVTTWSAGMTVDPGNGNIALRGVFYQPRGAWINLANGTAGISCGGKGSACPLQIVTGAMIMGNGDTSALLAGPSNSLLKYKAALIQ